jgi:hypothetical protein
MIGLDYEDDFTTKIPWEEITNGTEVFMVDFCLPDIEDMRRLQELSGHYFIWCDHHHTAITKAKEAGFTAPGLRRVGEAGCELTWEWLFYPNPIPLAVHLLGRYDVWDESQPNWQSQTLPFQYGMRGYQTDPSKVESIHIWYKLIPKMDARFQNSVCDLGSRILQYQQIENAKLMARQAFPTEFHGMSALTVNHGPGSSMKFEADHFQKNYPLLISFARLPLQKWLVNLYTFREDVDCGEIARRHGGGGASQSGRFHLRRRTAF